MFIKLVEYSNQIKNIKPCRVQIVTPIEILGHAIRILYCVGEFLPINPDYPCFLDRNIVNQKATKFMRTNNLWTSDINACHMTTLSYSVTLPKSYYVVDYYYFVIMMRSSNQKCNRNLQVRPYSRLFLSIEHHKMSRHSKWCMLLQNLWVMLLLLFVAYAANADFLIVI